jgi:primosomal protein N'
MKRFRDIDILPAYYKGVHDIAKDFYLPCMKSANKYDRATAYFSSAVFIVAWPSLIEFVKNEGKIRLICSPFLNRKDIEAIDEGHRGKTNVELGIMLERQINEMLENPILSKPTRVIASLVSMGIMDIRIAQPDVSNNPFSSRLFHDKVGIFTDSHNDKIVFKGSMNETKAGLSLDGNIESVDVYMSWGDERENNRVIEEMKYYNALWNNKYPEVAVLDFPEAAATALLESSDHEQWEKWTNEISESLECDRANNLFGWANGREPYPHQKDALNNWKNKNRKGILEHATGSGKTFTAILAIRDSIAKNEIPLVLVPSIERIERDISKIDKRWRPYLNGG